AVADSEFASAARLAWRPLRLAAAGLGLGLVLGAVIQWLVVSAEVSVVQSRVPPAMKRVPATPAAAQELEAQLDAEEQLDAMAEREAEGATSELLLSQTQ